MPVVGGNVSLYNEGGEGPIYPTPVVGMVGHLPDARRAGGLGFAADGHEIALVGPFSPDLHGSELAKLAGAELPLGLPGFELEAVRAAIEAVRDGVREGSLASAHDVAEGGLAVALAESVLAGGRGARVRIDPAALTPGHTKLLPALFGESPGGFVVSGSPAALRALRPRVRVLTLGVVGGDELSIEAGDLRLAIELSELRQAVGALAALFA